MKILVVGLVGRNTSHTCVFSVDDHQICLLALLQFSQITAEELYTGFSADIADD